MPTKVALAQMVDLALGTPEVGAVNFNVLHTLLHAMLKRLNILDTTAEINEFDRDFLASSKTRSVSGLSDLDSGKGDDSEDGMSEKSVVPPSKRSPYHHLELKVARLMEQMDQLNNLPSNVDLFERSTKSEGEQRPVSDMWQYMQLKKRVDTNEEGVGKLMSLVEDLMKQMQDLKDSNKDLMDKVKNLNLDDLMKRLKALEDKTNELNDKFNELPTPEELAQFVTWPGLEDALRGIRTDFEGMSQPTERVVIEMSSQTEPQSRPTSSRPSTRMSSTGPSAELLDILERLGKLTEDHEALKCRVDELEEQLKNKLDKDALESLNLSADFLDQLGQLKEDIKELQNAREKLNAEDMLTSSVALLKASSILLKSKRTSAPSDLAPLSESEEGEGNITSDGELLGERPGEVRGEVGEKTSEELLAIMHEKEMERIAMEALVTKVNTLEDRFRVLQEMMTDDSAYQSDVSDLKGWLNEMEKREDPLAGMTTVTAVSTTPPIMLAGTSPDKEVKRKTSEPKEISESKSDELKKQYNMKYAQEILEIFEATEAVTPVEEEVKSATPTDLQQTNRKIKTLAQVLNEQLHTLRDKLFALDRDLKRMAKGVEFALHRGKSGGSDMDSDALSRAQQAILQLQAEVEKLHNTTKDIIEENNNRGKQIDDLFQYCDKLQEIKADKEYVQMEVDVKADKRSLDNKVNHSLFDSATNEINSMIKEILDKLNGCEDHIKTSYKQLNEDLDGKLDRLELDPLKSWLESKLKALNDKLKRHQIQSVEWTEDDAAGIRKQLIQRFHCISCDRPVDLVPTGPVPSLPTNTGLPPTRSPRPYTTFELDQIRQHAKRGMMGKNNINFERALAEKQIARMRKSDMKAFLVHFRQELESFHAQRAAYFAHPEVSDYYATTRPCGGSHTLTQPHKRITRLSHLSHLFREDDGAVYPIYKEEVDVQGADGHIYRGRTGNKLEAKLPGVISHQTQEITMVTSQPRTRIQRPTSARVVQSPRATSARASPRPQSARQGGSGGVTPGPESSHTTPVPPESPIPEVPQDHPVQIEVPTTGE